MAATMERAVPRGGQVTATGARAGGGVARGLAVLGVLFLAWEAWTLVGWLADGPHQITQYRDHASASWWAARAYEGLAILLALVMGTHIVRGVRRAGRLTLDAKLCIGSFLGFWFDPSVNFIGPAFFYSSNWVNLNAWTGHMPGVVNPAAGEMPEPVLFLGLVYAFGLVTFSMIDTALLQAIRRRRPSLSRPRLLAIGFAWALCIDLAFELPMFRLHTWSYPGMPGWAQVLGPDGATITLIGSFVAALSITGITAVRLDAADHRGRSFIDRSLERGPGRRPGLVGVLATIAVVQALYCTAGLISAPSAFWSAPYPHDLPRHIRNGICGPGTAYGPCPGSPGFRLPIR